MRAASEPQPVLGQALRELRKHAGLSQEEVAHGAGLHVTWLSKIENGHNNPAWGTVTRLLDQMDVSLGTLATRIERIELE